MCVCVCASVPVYYHVFLRFSHCLLQLTGASLKKVCNSGDCNKLKDRFFLFITIIG